MTNKQLLTFRKANSVPSGGYAYVDPNKNFRIVGGSMSGLVNQVKSYRRANGFEIESNLAAIIEDWICQRIPVDQTSAYEKNSPPAVTNATSATIIGVTSHLLQLFKLNGRKKVAPSVTIARAEVCRKCPKNIHSIACASCQGITPWVRGRVNGNKSNEEGLHICSASAVMNIAQIYIPIDVIKKTMTEEQIKSHGKDCWKVKEL